MKKIVMKAAAILSATMFLACGSVAYAAESGAASDGASVSESAQEGLVIEIPEAAMKVEVPEMYEYVFDQHKSYRGDLGEYGIDVTAYMKTMAESCTRLDALYIEDGYAVESFIVYDPSRNKTNINGSGRNLSTYSDDEVRNLGFTLAMTTSSSGADQGILDASPDGVYRDKNGMAYACLKLTFAKDESEQIGTYCMFTIVDGKSYYIYTKGYNPEKEAADFKETTQMLVEGITYDNAPDMEAIAKQKEEAEKAAAEKAAAEASELAAAESSVEETTLEEEVKELQKSEYASKTAEEIKKEREKQAETTHMYFVLGQWIGRLLIVGIIAAVIFGILKSRRS